jgi:hypothetical protein
MRLKLMGSGLVGGSLAKASRDDDRGSMSSYVYCLAFFECWILMLTSVHPHYFPSHNPASKIQISNSMRTPNIHIPHLARQRTSRLTQTPPCLSLLHPFLNRMALILMKSAVLLCMSTVSKVHPKEWGTINMVGEKSREPSNKDHKYSVRMILIHSSHLFSHPNHQKISLASTP